jgi:hypothetical protein
VNPYVYDRNSRSNAATYMMMVNQYFGHFLSERG